MLISYLRDVGKILSSALGKGFALMVRFLLLHGLTSASNFWRRSLEIRVQEPKYWAKCLLVILGTMGSQKASLEDGQVWGVFTLLIDDR